ncbi:hypothetical protein F2Q70_00001938 [Brassica cretica]|uniref:NB-ARC domain-containing protein n=1 Tax=Brassica cretica TaxID=69181 RepID=A0A8S9IP41_BRACR|nr:hypothetical protein F2Q70_00001938 [Brassica cretica]
MESLLCLHSDEVRKIGIWGPSGIDSPYAGFEKLAGKVTNLVGELPLGLKVMGSFFRGMSRQKWEKSLLRLTKHLDGSIARILKFSYDALDMEDKVLFLYIACFFNYESIAKLEKYLANEFSDLRSGLDILAEKSLISMNNSGYLEMQKLLEQLGRDIVHQEYIREPGRPQFLVDTRNIREVLTNNTVSTNVRGIKFDLSELSEDFNISERAFEGLSNLQFLRFHYRIGNRRNQLHLPRGLNNIPTGLRILHWDQFPGTSLPSDMNPQSLVELVMHGSKLEKLWEETKPLGKLRWINLSSSVNLKELPDLSLATNLEEMDLNQCTSLVELPSSIGKASNLKKLDLVHCSSLVQLPSSIGDNTNLQNLDLSNCSSLVELPSSMDNLINLEKVNLSHCSSLVKFTCSHVRELNLAHCSTLVELAPSTGTLSSLEKLDLSHCSSIVELPSSVENATKLLHLNLEGCSSLMDLPSCIGNATSLQKFYLNNCSSLEKLPSSIGSASNLEKLDLSNCSNLVELPSSIGNAINLLYLSLIGCSRLVKLPSSMGNLTSLKILYLNNCSNLVELHYTIGNAISLEKLDLSNCSSLVKLPHSIGKATNLQKLKLVNCSSLVELPSSIGNLFKLQLLCLKGCSKLEISTYIGVLRLKGTAIKEVPSSTRLWCRLATLQMSYTESLKELTHALSCITELQLSNTEIQEISPWVKEISKLRRFVINGCRKVVSLPQLSDSLSSLHAENCRSLERLDCSFHNPQIRLNFANCFRLNKEAIALIIHTSTRRHAVFPGGEVPAYFTYRATGGSLMVKLNERRSLPVSLRFKACVLPVSKADDDTGDDESLMTVYITIMEKQSGLGVPCRPRELSLPPPLTGHLYTFEIEAKVTSTELTFEFSVHRENWEIGECGVFELMEAPRVHEHDVSSDSDIGGNH